MIHLSDLYHDLWLMQQGYVIQAVYPEYPRRVRTQDDVDAFVTWWDESHPTTQANK